MTMGLEALSLMSGTVFSTLCQGYEHVVHLCQEFFFNDSESELNQEDHADQDTIHALLGDITIQANRYSLITALDNGDTEAALEMIKHHSYYINECDQEGFTALHLCCCYMYIQSDNTHEYLK